MATTPSLTVRGQFGDYGGRYVPETVIPALEELEEAYASITDDAEFQSELNDLLDHYVGRPTPIYHAARLSAEIGGAQIYLKREDLAHTGAHKINNALGQALLAKRLGRNRIIAETGAGQHGVATAAACAMLGLECIVYMGEVDVHRQTLNVFRMKLLGTTVVPVLSGSRTLKTPSTRPSATGSPTLRPRTISLAPWWARTPIRQLCATCKVSSAEKRANSA